MQAVIMAGGKGTRLRDITGDEIPKPMVQIGGKPLLQWQVEKLHSNGIEDIIIVIGHLGDVIKKYFQDGAEYGVQITYFEEKEPLGTAGALYELRGRLEDVFFLLFGDVLFDVDLMRMKEFHCKKGAAATLFVHPNTHPEDSDLAVLDEGGRVVRFAAKNSRRDGWYRNCVNAGIYVLSLDTVCSVKQRGKLDLEKDVLSALCGQQSSVYAYKSTEYVKDAGTAQRIMEAARDLASAHPASRNLREPQKAIFFAWDTAFQIRQEDSGGSEQLEAAADALRLINQSGYLAFVVAGRFVTQEMGCRIETLLGREGVFVDDICFNSESTDDEEVRKAIGRYHIDCKASWMIGDNGADIRLGEANNMRTVLADTGFFDTVKQIITMKASELL